MKNACNFAATVLCTLLFKSIAVGHHTPGSASTLSLNATGSSITLNKGQWLIESPWGYRTYRPFSKVQLEGIALGQRKMTDISRTMIGALRINYGVSDKLTLAVQQPFFLTFARTLVPDAPSTFDRKSQQANRHLGDVAMSANLLVYKNPQGNVQLSALAGMEAPIAKETNQQLPLTASSGSFDPLFGGIFNSKWRKASISGNVIYKVTTSGFSGVDYGDFLSYELSFVRSMGENQCRGLPPDHSDSTQCCADKSKKVSWNLFTAVRGEYLQPQRDGVGTIPNTGYHQHFAGVGVSLSINNNLILPVSVEIPVHTKLIGYQNKPGWSLRASASLLF